MSELAFLRCIQELIDLALRDMGDDSLVGIVDLMTGEKDPRNLMLVFSILKVVMVEWDISNHAEVWYLPPFCLK